MMISYQTSPEEYKHWKLEVSDKVAFLILDIDEDGGIQDGYQLKLNSYDLGVDIELNDALNRIRFEHPRVQCVVFKSGKNKMFCSGANIYMLGQSIHAWKVNFCKFTNETRNGIEDSSQRENIKFIAAINGTVAGGGYELALACDKILMIDDRSSTVSLPEVPLLGVLPGTGGLTRLTDKRGVRKDHADIFCTTSEGIKAERALEWKIVDNIAKPKDFNIDPRAMAFIKLRRGDIGLNEFLKLTKQASFLKSPAILKILQSLGLAGMGGGIGYGLKKGLDADDSLGAPYNYKGNPNK